MFGVPLVFQVLQILGILLVVRHDYDSLEAHYRERHTNPDVYRDMVNKLYRTEDNGGGNNQDTIDAFIEQKFEKKVEENSGDTDE